MNVKNVVRLGILALGGFSTMISVCSCDPKDTPVFKEDDEPKKEEIVTKEEIKKQSISVNTNITLMKGDSLKADESKKMRYVAWVIGDSAKVVEKISSATPKFNLNIPHGKYKLVVWSDYSNSSLNDEYFDTSKPDAVSINSKYQFVPNDPYRMAYRGESELVVSAKTTDCSVELKPQMAQIKILNYKELNYELGKFKVIYPHGIITSVNAITGEFLANSSKGDYVTTLKDNLILKDNLFISKDAESVYVTVEAYDKNDKLMCRTSIDSKIVKGETTTFTLDFTKNERPNGFIDTSYDNVTITYY